MNTPAPPPPSPPPKHTHTHTDTHTRTHTHTHHHPTHAHTHPTPQPHLAFQPPSLGSGVARCDASMVPEKTPQKLTTSPPRATCKV
jgi:hypothetical protein